MLKKLLMGSLAVAALALNAPVAQAAAVTADCGFNTIAQETATGGQDTFTGAAYGFAVSDGGDVSVYCEVRVNGSPVAATDPGPSGPVSVTAGPVTYTASDTDNVELCAVYSGPGGSGEVCGETTTTQIPPEAVFDLIDLIFETLLPIFEEIDRILIEVTSIPDFIICPILMAAAPGVPGVVDIEPEGDTSILGEPFWNCPPYDS